MRIFSSIFQIVIIAVLSSGSGLAYGTANETQTGCHHASVDGNPIIDIPASSSGLTLCTLFVHSDLNPFEISIYWTGPPEAGQGFRRAHTLTVSAIEDDSVTVFDGLEANYYDSIDIQGYLIREDMNFDGYTDFRLMESPSAGPNTYWYFWLFDPETRTFQRAIAFEESNLVSPQFMQDDKLIMCFHRDGMGEYGREYYTCENDLPILIRSVQIEYSEPDSSLVTVSELIHGEMVIIEQTKQAVE